MSEREEERAAVELAAKIVGAVEADIPGLWNAPGYPELTTAQLIQVAGSTI